MPSLAVPNVRFHRSFVEAWDEFGERHPDGWATHPIDRKGWDLRDAAGFATWVESLLLAADPSVPRAADWVPATARWIVSGDEFLGAIHLRHGLTPFLERVGGHIGYGIRPAARRRGLATMALRETLDAARRVGLDRVLVTCDDSNVASAATIERCGGVLENVRDVDDWARERGFDEPIRRYWIELEG